MANLKGCALAVSVILAECLASSPALAGETVQLRETARKAEATRVLIRLKAEGLYRPTPPPGQEKSRETESAKSEAHKPVMLKVETRLEFLERALKVGENGTPLRSVRRVVRAGSAVNVDKRPMMSTLRPEVAILVAEARPEGVSMFSPGGPLTRAELELVQGPADPLALAALLPSGSVALGEKWKIVA